MLSSGGRHVSSAAPSIMQRQQAQSARQHQTTQVQGMLRAPVSRCMHILFSLNIIMHPLTAILMADWVLTFRLSDRNPKDVELLESAVVTWQQQVEAALNIDPDAALKVRRLASVPAGFAFGNLGQDLTFCRPSSEDVSHIVLCLVECHHSNLLLRRKANIQARMWRSNIGRIDQEI